MSSLPPASSTKAHIESPNIAQAVKGDIRREDLIYQTKRLETVKATMGTNL
jgi:hypothetical protein